MAADMLRKLLGMSSQSGGAPLLPKSPQGDPSWGRGSAPLLPHGVNVPSPLQKQINQLRETAYGPKAPLLPSGFGEGAPDEPAPKPPGGSSAGDIWPARITAAVQAAKLLADLYDRYSSKGRARRQLQDSIVAQQAVAADARHRYQYGSKAGLDPKTITKLT